jgi:hypothetical protein
MADSGKPSAEAYNASSVAGENTHEGALPHRLLPDGSDTLSQLAEADLREWCPDAGACHHSCRASARPPDMDWALFAPEQEVPHG